MSKSEIKKDSGQVLKKLIIIIFLIPALYSCGFQVIYKDKPEKKTDASYVNQMAAIRIKKDRNRLSQELKNNLYDLLNPDYIKVDPKYFLILAIKQTTSATYITSTGASGRNKITLDISYKLQNLETGDLISSGSTSVNDNYNITSNRYGTYTAEEYIKSNLTKLAAQNIRNSLVNDFIEAQKKCQFSDTTISKTNKPSCL
jgi:hypothetical protein